MKNSVILRSAFLASVLFMLFSCSKDSKTSDEGGQAFREGDLEIGVDNDGVYKITDENAVKEIFKETLKEQKIDDTITSIEIIKSAVESSNEESYLLYGHNEDFSLKTAFIINLNANVFSISASPEKISCKSTDCQFGCAPSILLNPATRKRVLTCSSCVNTCTKIASAGYSGYTE